MIVLNLCHNYCHVSQVMTNDNPDTIVVIFLIWSDVKQLKKILAMFLRLVTACDWIEE